MNKVGEAIVTKEDFEKSAKSQDPVFCAIGLAIARVDLSHVCDKGDWGFYGNGELYCYGGNGKKYKHLYVKYTKMGDTGAMQDGVFHRKDEIRRELKQGKSVTVELMEWTQWDEDDFWREMMSPDY